MSIFCGSVASNGQIISNNNFSCQYDSGQQKYTISYNGNVNDGASVVVSQTLQIPGLSYILYSYNNGFTMQVFQVVDGVYTPVASGFNFIVDEL
ncbi:hypothetical protein [Kordia jejudonensis]|uniref:hypothetical protein n=1 Tax=Kordia jejudonensis TaxID=1348245 RepID=UPI0006297A7A|nr:hypothetical protein [Kordia jejudonensis]